MGKQTNILIEKLENFIRKFYKNQLLKGAILGVSMLIIAFFVLSFAEYFGRFNTSTRTTLFYLFIAANIGILIWYIVRPLLGLYNVNRQFGIEEASKLIGNHFPTVKDKLINTLQLQSEASSSANNSLLMASIEQKTHELKPVPFSKAIQFSSNNKYVKFALLPALALITIMLISPGFKSSSSRIVNFDEHYEIQAPFSFQTSLNEIQAIQNQDIEIPLQILGNEIPEDSYIHVGENRYKMKSSKVGEYFFTIKNIQKSEEIYFEAGGFNSEKYILPLALKPSILDYKANLVFPKYLNMPSEERSNLGEISVPQGTRISWLFTTKNVNEIKFNNSEILNLAEEEPKFSRRFMRTSEIQVNTSNSKVAEGDSVRYRINVIPDQFPTINAFNKEDSLSAKILYFLGDVGDDYGFNKLEFNYRFVKTTNSENKGKSGKLDVAIDKNVVQQKFYHYWNLNALNVQPEDEIEYFFTIWDNDGVNGSKPTQTTAGIYKAPSLKEIKEKTEKANEEIKNSLAGAKSQSTELEKEIKSVEKMLTEKKSLDWNDKKKIEDLLKKQEEMQKNLKEAIQKNLEKNLKEEEFKEVDEQLLEKQKQLEKLMEEVMDEETKKLMEKIQKLLDQNRMDKLQQEMENFKLSEQEMNKKMDRMLELFKELELEKKMNETIDKLEELAKEQKDLAKKSKNKEGSSEDLKKKQDDLNKKFDDLKKDMDDIQKKNKELESPKGIEDRKEQKESISQKQQQGSDKLGKGKKSKAGEDQEDAAEEMQEMAEDMWQEMQEEYADEQEEDYNNLRQILENLVTLSFDQEKVMDGFKANQSYNANFIELRQKQRKIKEETKIVEDSLLALSKRNVQIQHFVNDEIAKVNYNLDKSLTYLGETRDHTIQRSISSSLNHQQFAMTSYNNLALMLTETLKQMQEQMKANKQNKGKPKGQCKKPGSKPNGKKGKPNMSAIKKMQQQMAKQLEELQKGMKPGGGKPGQGGQPSSKQFAQMAAEQAAIRKKLQDLQRQLDKEGKGGSLGNLKQTQDMMDDIEKDLYFKKLDITTMDKLKKIEIKLSQHEKAQKEQEQDQKRTSNEGKDRERILPPNIKKYLEEKQKETELLRNVSPELQPYYQKKVKEYFGK